MNNINAYGLREDSIVSYSPMNNEVYRILGLNIKESPA